MKKLKTFSSYFQYAIIMSKNKITNVKGRMVFDSRGIPTVEAEGAEDGARAERQLHGQARAGRGEGQDQGEVSD